MKLNEKEIQLKFGEYIHSDVGINTLCQDNSKKYLGINTHKCLWRELCLQDLSVNNSTHEKKNLWLLI